ncbi:MAG: response regulator transcription factor [Chloroflexi bacterium]|nr:response regulator transcription factor [Chloroflexota bacterium]
MTVVRQGITEAPGDECDQMAEPAGTVGRILVVDDARSIHQLLSVGLGEAGFEVVCAADGPEGLAKFLEQRPDAAIVDVLMPRMDGYELCRRLREISDAPIIMLSALRNEAEIVRGLEAGADDYVTKPFSVTELAARLRAHLRRQRRADAPQRHLAFDGGRLTIDLDSLRVVRDGNDVPLSATEFRLFEYLAANAGRVVPHRELVSHLWGKDGDRLAPYLKIYVRRLRQKVEPDPAQPRYVLSRHGTGYFFPAEAGAADTSSGAVQ